MNRRNLLDLPYWATGEDCFKIVAAKATEKAEKVAASNIKIAKRADQATKR